MPAPIPSTPSGYGHCPQCLRRVLWTVTAHARRQAVDPDPHPEGRVAVYQDQAGRWRSRQLSTDRPTPEHAEQLHMAHAATCPNPAPRRATPRTPPRTVRRLPWNRPGRTP